MSAVRTAAVVPLLACLLVLPLTGCWDRNEINEYAFWIGTAIDLTKDGQFETSAQVAIPSKFISSKGQGSGGQRANIVLSAKGETLLSAMQQIQDKLPRRIFLGHRKAIFIGEELARKGLSDMMDQFMRNPDTRLRTDIFVVNGGEGREALEINSPFNQFSAIAAVDQDHYCRLGDTALRDVLLDAGRDGIRPSMPMIEIAPQNDQEKGRVFDVKSVAIFNRKLQMVGKVSERESLELFWVKGILKDQYMMEVTDEGRFTVYESSLGRTIRTTEEGGKVSVRIKLTGNGKMLENNSAIDLSVSAERERIERILNERIAQQIESMIRSVQRSYGQDVFGFGEAFHREHPYRWKALRGRWDEIFPTAEVAVDVDLDIQSVGDLGKPVPL